MSDPFATFDPNAAKKSAGFMQPPQQQHQQPLYPPVNNYATTMSGGVYPPAAPVGVMPYPNNNMGGNPFGGGFNNATLSPTNVSKPPTYVNGANFMTQAGAPSFGGLGAAPSMQMNMNMNMNMNTNPFQQQQQPPQQQVPGYFATQPMQGGAPQSQPYMYDNIKNLFQPKQPANFDPFAPQPQASGVRGAEPTASTTAHPAPIKTNSTIIDFDPFSPRDSTPALPFDFPAAAKPATATASAAPTDRKRATQEEQRSQLAFDAQSFATAPNNSKTSSLRNIPAQQQPQTHHEDNFFSEGSSNDFFASQSIHNVDERRTSGSTPRTSSMTARRKSQEAQFQQQDDQEVTEDLGECAEDEYEVTFESGKKLGVLMERLDLWGKGDDKRQEIAIVKLVVENGSADRLGVQMGSAVLAINGRSVAKKTYNNVLELVRTAPRPMTIRFRRGDETKDTTQGHILARISSGTFSVGNFTSGNAVWTQKYFAFGGAKLDVLQLFVSRAAYHECVISLYEKRAVHTQIQSFRLCRDHKISPIKSKIYKGYGNLHYFSLTVPSLRFVAAKFASEDYETLKNLWTHTYDAIERRKRMGGP